MFEWLKYKKSVTRPHSITVEQFVKDGWQANIDNAVCDVLIWEDHYGWLKIWSICPKDHPFVRNAYTLSFSNLDYQLDFYPVIHKTRLQVIYHDPVPFKPKTIPEQAPGVVTTHEVAR